VTIPRLYIPRLLEVGELCAVTSGQIRYIQNVMRMREGDALVVFNGTGREYEAAVRQTQEGLRLDITGSRAVPAGGIEITLCQAIPKAEKLDGIIRRATELGAGRIVPFLAARSIPRWPAAKSQLKRERWQKIALEAARQCGRNDIPEIAEIAAFDEMLRLARDGALNLILWEEEADRGIRGVLRDPANGGTRDFLLVIGPEGGFSGDEVDRARAAGLLSVSLGKRVLRVETAALSALAILQYEKGALGVADAESSP
jgi:16S rRNA (uracil1498-N3)-methyltransferase